MKKKNLLIAFTVLTTGTVWAEDLPKDTLKVVDIEEVVVIAAPKENRKLREQPTAVTLLSQQEMQANQVTSIKSLTALVPNIFIPDYGSKLTSAIYIRGIGSRINTPSVGLYVDNVPYIDKSAFDFNYSDIERIDVLRGPQGTLYGRNTMGGLIKVHTKSPFTYQGTDLRLSAGTYNEYNASVTHYHRTSDKFAFSTGGFYEYGGGFFKNSYLNKKVDRTSAGGGRFRGIYLPTANLKIDLNTSYEYSDEGGYPYVYTGRTALPEGATDPRAEHIGKISYNDESSYHRSLFNTGVNLEYQAQNFILSAVTGYQNLNDRMALDQDFTERDIFNLVQKQKLHTITEEVMLKSKPGGNWQWATGAFGFYQWLNTDGPVTFKETGVDEVIEGNANKAFDGLGPKAPSMHMTVNNPTLRVSGNFDTPILSGAIYHQSTFNNLLVKGLSATVGLRLDYEKISMKYHSVSDPIDFDFKLSMQMSPSRPPLVLSDHNMKAPAQFTGKLSNDYLQLLPKFALQYEWQKGNSVYATASRGYRSGGYNVQMFSDLVQNDLQRSMMNALKESKVFSAPPFGEMVGQMIDQMMPDPVDVEATTTYKPEYSWNYEVGSHLTLWEGRLWVDLAAFYMDTRDQQVAQFAESGLGRVTVNAGKSRSYGAEASLRASITDALSLHANYGYTYATFRDYETIDSHKAAVNYKGNYVPFVPKHTFSAGAQYIFRIAPRCWLDQVQLNGNYNGAGRIYWTEANNVSQSFYGTLSGRVSLEKGNGAIAFWVRNALDKNYAAFYFESMGNGFEQKGRPMQLGVDVRCRF